MTRTLWFKKIWKGRSKGVSTVIGTVFLMLIIFMVATNVLLWTFSQDAEYTQAVQGENQKNVDRLSENVIASDGRYFVFEDEVTVEATLTNAGSVAVQVINLWVFDTNSSNQRFANRSLDLSLNPGEVFRLEGSSLNVTIPEVDESHLFVSWFVTARGNTIPVESEIDALMADIAQGIGSISMDFPTFRYYEVNELDQLGPAYYSFNLPAKKNTVIGVYLRNLDPRRGDITI
ncbi:hypothetical protein E3J49_03720, partial [Candidatus Bathyarchaeota archaeon]